ncbi:prolyl oligopeptidase family serine peptidase [Prosthecochloris sp. SCSIO W1103]|uniref:prolyl oligopeptidase family serine peptidase n=1 Tax=Prosthecochloris sp. SCSIO W1103 TaxID=2992244 RepID=UPI00223D7069|nr:prolyl oligopeptidase family serine peptidase [Prosthecochloris sp. SCSIO W1103]UZJ36634.1 prolyl oligopeptidase family serine peptidase [Prosthecochloris sp. SCSIO W1103]
MKKASSLFLILSLFWNTYPQITRADDASTAKKPLNAPAKIVEESYCGKKIADPYRYMENLEDPFVRQWLIAQAEYARSIIEKIPGRTSLIEKMQDFDSRKAAKVYNLVITDNDWYFYLKRTPADETGKLYYRKGFQGTESLLFDPSDFSKNSQKKYAVSNISPTDDGSKVAVSVAADGSEDDIVLIMDVKVGRFYPEKIDRCRFASPSWLPDGRTFLYNRLQKSGKHDTDIQKNSKVYLHEVGSDPSLDREIFSRATNPEMNIKPEDIPSVHYDKDSKHLYAFVHNVDRRLTVFYAPVSELGMEKISWKPLLKPENNIHDFAVTEKDLYLYTPEKAPNFKVLKTSLFHPDIDHAETVIPENPDAVLTSFNLTSNGIYYTLSKNGVEVEFFHKKFNRKKAKKLQLPFPAGTIHLSTKGFKFPDVWVVISGWSSDYKRYRYDEASKSFVYETLSSAAEYPEYDDLVVQEIMVPSHDGVKVPLSLIYKKGLNKNSRNPVLFYGYGAYGKSLRPFFNPPFLLWAYKGGILAVAHVRGGGEMGDAWHKAGMKTTKFNTWQDLISCAEYVIDKKYTAPSHIAINSASAGGILVGKAMTERPDLFAAVIPQVGAMNPLRGEETPNGPVNTPEFGTVNDPVECRALIAMDPYLSIRKGVTYPAALVTAGINDPRVIAWQPAKFAAHLQAASVSGKPVLFYTDFQSGHGIGNTKTKQFETLADVLSFAFWQTGHPEFQPEHSSREN